MLNRYCGVWIWRLSFFILFLLMILAGKSWIQPLLNKGEIPEKTRSRLVRKLVAEVRSGVKEFALRFSYFCFFLLRQLSSVTSR